MPEQLIPTILQWLHPKDDERNLISAGFHMITITFISMSLVDLNWFVISSDVCVPYLTMGQFFWFGYTDDPIDTSEYACINSTIVNMMRITILLSFMAIIFSLMGFFLDILSPKNILYKMIRRYAVPGTCTVLWIMVIISFSYYIVLLLEDAIEKNYPKSDSTVTYGLGLYLMAAAGGVASIGIIYTLVLAHHPPTYSHREDDRCLIDGFDVDDDTFNTPTPPPPYNIPPPPYTP